ncbi:5171_t:CDS:10 [Paraglomus brasilianum]|uniref:5171_t:CDS:1 n=1 Tax=Paraglomus brasilianum TaxID=144538 RepID=A0A9N8WBJ5_9GLOM|nr:5171_t:CDS:10 [Paraglomus brasilianum]
MRSVALNEYPCKDNVAYVKDVTIQLSHFMFRRDELMDRNTNQNNVSSWLLGLRHQPCTAESEKVIVYLNTLHEGLISCKTPEECNSRYPQGINTLTELARKDGIALDPVLCKHLVNCLLEYSKVIDSADKSQNELHNHHRRDKASHNLADYCGVGTTSLDQAIVNESVGSITRFLDMMEQNSRALSVIIVLIVRKKRLLFASGDPDFIHCRTQPECLRKVSEKCIPMLGDTRFLNLIGRIVRAATCSVFEDKMALSETFIEELIYYKHDSFELLDDEAKFGVWACFPAASEFEIMSLFRAFLSTSDQTYVSPWQIRKSLRASLFIRGIFARPRLLHISIEILVNILNEMEDWRVVRLAGCLVECIVDRSIATGGSLISESSTDSLDILVGYISREEPSVRTISKINSIRNNISLECPPAEIYKRKQCVWLLLMSLNKWRYWIIRAIFDRNSFPRVVDLEPLISYIVWLSYPQRESVCLDTMNVIGDIICYLRAWLCVGGNDYGPVISHLNRYKHIFKNNNLLVDLSLGLWSAVGSSKLLEALIKPCIAASNGVGTQTGGSSHISLTALTIILDYLHENQFLAIEDEYLGEFTKSLEGDYRLFLSQI